MKKNVILFFLLLAVCSCVKENSAKKEAKSADIASVDKMTSVLVDVLLAEGAVSLKEAKQQDVKYYTWHYYNFVLKKHNMSIGQFRKSYNYYSSDVEEMLKIMTNVIDSLSQKQSKVRNQK
jgi:hypothetical protein